MSNPTVKNLSFTVGSNVVFGINVANTNGGAVDLTGYTANATFKRHNDSANVNSFTTSLNANGYMTVHLNAANSATFDADRYVYRVDITNTSSNTIQTVQRGLMVLQSYA